MLTTEYLDYWTNFGWREYVRHMGLYSVLAVVLVIIGPFGTDQDPFLWRFAYWLVMMGFFGGVIMPCVARLSRPINILSAAPIVPGVVALLCLGTVPMTMFVMLTDGLIYKWMLTADWAAIRNAGQIMHNIEPPKPFNLRDAVILYGQVLAVVLISSGAISVFIGYRYNRRLQSPAPHTRAGVSFFSRLPDHIGTDLIYLQMEDHYVRAVTRDGNALILMRFRDAMHEIAGIGGFQAHRSYWAASAHVVKLSRSGRKLELIMSNDARIPISSSYRESVEELVTGQSKRKVDRQAV